MENITYIGNMKLVLLDSLWEYIFVMHNYFYLKQHIFV